MTHWKAVLARFADNADDYFDRLVHQYRQRTGRIRPLQIVPYRGFGNAGEIYVKGRVLEDKNIPEAGDRDSMWQNLLAMYKRFESNEVPGVQVQLKLGDNTHIATTDEEGYFQFRLPLVQPFPGGQVWHEVELELIEPFVKGQAEVKATGQVLIPPPNSQFGVISDIDDTILVSEVTHLLKMARLAFLNNARTRLPFAGVAAFYRALQHGPMEGIFNPVYYVSSSPWNLYDLLADFCEIQGIPTGPFMLRDVGINQNQVLASSHAGHKTIQIEHIMRMSGSLPFVLIGDSGQHDPEIYLQVIQDYPERVKVIYIREVTTEKRREQVRQLAEKAKEWNVPMLLVKDTVEAAMHAASAGFIHPDAITGIQNDKRSDEKAPTDLEQLVGE